MYLANILVITIQIKKHVHLTTKWRMPTRSMAQVLTVEML